MFPSKGGFIGMLFEVKETESSTANILTVDAFKEVYEFYNLIQTIEHKGTDTNGNDVTLKWDSICIKIGPEGS
jgi:hypothetical protein